MPLPHNSTSILRVRLGDATVGLPALAVREIVRAVAITPVAGAPGIVEGAVNVRGCVVPVIDVRQRLGLPPKQLDPDEFLIVLDAGPRMLALRVDDVDDLVDADTASIAEGGTLSPALRALAGLSAHAEGVLVIHDPASFISQAEMDAATAALAAHP